MKYGESTTIYFPIYMPNGSPIDNVVYARMCTAKISKDGGAFTATTNSITYAGENLCSLVLTATEMTCDDFVIILDTWNIGVSFTPPIVGETTRDVDLSGVLSALDTVKGLAGHFTVTTNTLTIYDDSGVATGTFTLTRNAEGEIVEIEPQVPAV